MTRSTAEEDSLDSTLPGGYLDGQMESTTISTGRGWRKIGGNGRT